MLSTKHSENTTYAKQCLFPDEYKDVVAPRVYPIPIKTLKSRFNKNFVAGQSVIAADSGNVMLIFRPKSARQMTTIFIQQDNPSGPGKVWGIAAQMSPGIELSEKYRKFCTAAARLRVMANSVNLGSVVQSGKFTAIQVADLPQIDNFNLDRIDNLANDSKNYVATQNLGEGIVKVCAPFSEPTMRAPRRQFSSVDGAANKDNTLMKLSDGDVYVVNVADDDTGYDTTPMSAGGNVVWDSRTSSAQLPKNFWGAMRIKGSGDLDMNGPDDTKSTLTLTGYYYDCQSGFGGTATEVGVILAEHTITMANDVNSFDIDTGIFEIPPNMHRLRIAVTPLSAAPGNITYAPRSLEVELFDLNAEGEMNNATMIVAEGISHNQQLTVVANYAMNVIPDTDNSFTEKTKVIPINVEQAHAAAILFEEHPLIRQLYVSSDYDQLKMSHIQLFAAHKLIGEAADWGRVGNIFKQILKTGSMVIPGIIGAFNPKAGMIAGQVAGALQPAFAADYRQATAADYRAADYRQTGRSKLRSGYAAGRDAKLSALEEKRSALLAELAPRFDFFEEEVIRQIILRVARNVPRATNVEAITTEIVKFLPGGEEAIQEADKMMSRSKTSFLRQAYDNQVEKIRLHVIVCGRYDARPCGEKCHLGKLLEYFDGDIHDALDFVFFDAAREKRGEFFLKNPSSTEHAEHCDGTFEDGVCDRACDCGHRNFLLPDRQPVPAEKIQSYLDDYDDLIEDLGFIRSRFQSYYEWISMCEDEEQEVEKPKKKRKKSEMRTGFASGRGQLIPSGELDSSEDDFDFSSEDESFEELPLPPRPARQPTPPPPRVLPNAPTAATSSSGGRALPGLKAKRISGASKRESGPRLSMRPSDLRLREKEFRDLLMAADQGADIQEPLLALVTERPHVFHIAHEFPFLLADTDGEVEDVKFAKLHVTLLEVKGGYGYRHIGTSDGVKLFVDTVLEQADESLLVAFDRSPLSRLAAAVGKNVYVTFDKVSPYFKELKVEGHSWNGAFYLSAALSIAKVTITGSIADPPGKLDWKLSGCLQANKKLVIVGPAEVEIPPLNEMLEASYESEAIVSLKSVRSSENFLSPFDPPLAAVYISQATLARDNWHSAVVNISMLMAKITSQKPTKFEASPITAPVRDWRASMSSDRKDELENLVDEWFDYQYKTGDSRQDLIDKIDHDISRDTVFKHMAKSNDKALKAIETQIESLNGLYVNKGKNKKKKGPSAKSSSTAIQKIRELRRQRDQR